MNRRQLALALHDLWERAQRLHLETGELVDRVPAREPYSRLAVEMAIHDLISFASRAAALATLAEGPPPPRSKR